jgi:hypothetical protein
VIIRFAHGVWVSGSQGVRVTGCQGERRNDEPDIQTRRHPDTLVHPDTFVSPCDPVTR